MRRQQGCSALLAMLLLLATAGRSEDPPKGTVDHWEIIGDLTEACTCSVPCTCNFGEGPSPHHFCHALFSLSIQSGHYGGLALDGLHMAGVHGKEAAVWYVDRHATPEQAAALRAIANHIYHREKVKVYFETAEITQEIGDKGNRLQVGDLGGFEAKYVIGLDGKTPVVVENNTTWNIPRSIKGKTQSFRYRDSYGNKIDVKNTNSNEGKFDWTDETKTYF